MEENTKEAISGEEGYVPMRREHRQKKQESDYFTRIIVTQAMVCAVLVLAVFLVGKMSPNSFAGMKEQFQNIMQTDMSAKDVFSKIKGAAMQVFVPRANNPGQSAETTAEDGAGGEDMTVFAATGTTSFSPYYLSSQICTPVSGRISSGFGYRINPVTKEWGFHTGIDIAAGQGEPIRAAFYGTVRTVGYSDTEGNYVVLEHDDHLITKYLHCSEILVKEGTTIRQGESIALVGSTGQSTGPHLHFVIEVNGKKVNPLYVLELNDGKV